MTPAAPATDWTEVVRRVDLVRWALGKQYPWAKRTLRNLEIVERHGGAGTIAVDKYLRLYVNPGYALSLNRAQLQGCIWHEVNHLLRRHDDRLSEHEDHITANIAADMEINADLRAQEVTLPDGLWYPELRGLEAGHAAEEYYGAMKMAKEQQQSQPGDGDEDWEDGEDEDDGDSGSGQQPGGVGPQDDAADDGDDDGDPGEGQQPGGGGEEQAAPQMPDAPQCGSGAGGEQHEDELPPPDSARQERLNREQRGQAEDILEEAAEHPGGYSPVGDSMVQAARELLGRSEVDWRRELGVEVRTYIEQVMDDAEEFTFRRPSRRQAALGEEFILPSSFRPIPHLAVIADVSGSMDEDALNRSMTELHSVLERLAIPEFMAYGWDDDLDAEVRVRSIEDIAAVYYRGGGGTKMLPAIEYAVQNGAEIILVLTDAQCDWQPWNINVPVIIGGINRDPGYSKNLPAHVKVIDVTPPMEKG